MNKVIWGKHVWKAIHYIALGYPDKPSEQQKEDYKKFYLLFSSVLPCKICREHYIKTLINHPLTDSILENKDNLIKWTIDLHNIVNQDLGYKILSYEDAIYDIKLNETCHNNNYNNNNYNYSEIFNFLLIIIILILFIFLFKK